VEEPEPSPPAEAVSPEQIQAHKMDVLGALAPGVLHDLNNPLAAIHGFSELLRRDPRLPTDLKEQAGLLVAEAISTRRLIQAIFDFMRRRPAERHPTSIRALVEAAASLVTYRLGSGGIELEVDVPGELPPVDVDRGQILQALLAIIWADIDAVAATGRAGWVRVEARLEGARVRLAIVHRAAGADGATAASGAPSDELLPDLRVPIALVAAHGGELRTLPGPDGHGATYTFDLPVHEAALSEAAAPRSPAAATLASEPAPPVRRILVLDDERPIRLLLEKWLRGAGFEPVVAERGEEAVELVRAAPFDAVLCDHRMAGMNGTEVFEAVVRIRPELGHRFVFMSGDILNPQLREFIVEHRVGLLPKPFDLETVRTTLEAVLD
jgi:two-component system NtrC family sensor kinase